MRWFCCFLQLKLRGCRGIERSGLVEPKQAALALIIALLTSDNCLSAQHVRLCVGHMRKVALHGRNICESALGASEPPPTPPSAQPHSAPPAGSMTRPQPPSRGGPVHRPPRKGAVHGDMPGSATALDEAAQAPTLIPYAHKLGGVLLADDATSKTALQLLFQLVQWQLRKAEKYKEVLIFTL